YENRVNDIKSKKKIDDQSARTLSIHYLKDKIRQITYSANTISSLKDDQIQNIINHFLKKQTNPDDKNNCQKKISILKQNAHVTESSNSNGTSNIKASIPTESSHTSNSEDMINEKVKDLPKTKASILSNPTCDHVYFRNKILKQYPNLCQEDSDGNNDYYGITDESLCPLYKLDHDDENGIEGRYEIRSYNLKCEQRGIEIEVTV
ncbi:15728_t:CDS:2, partial [Racocetra fulgida]